MKISYNWLKDYLDIQLETEAVSKILTDIGLEVEGVESIQSIKGGLDGIVIGEVKEVGPHPNADRLKVTKVDVAHSELLDIVCGAPNVAVGQKVLVALVGSTVYLDEKGIKIKKSKIRGEISEGMLCAEDELGLGKSHDGIMVLDKNAKIGQAAAEYFDIQEDVVFDIGLTPNRADATSHFGVARDLAAYLNIEEEVQLKVPSLDKFKEGENNPMISIEVEDSKVCPRYASIELLDLNVSESPNWLKNRILSIGLKPINNVVDVTNYVLHDLGQPLHAFDLDKIEGNKVLVRKAKAKEKFTTLDEEERELSTSDLMIANSKNSMCIAGVFGGIDSGVNEKTKNIFLESAYFDSTSIRKSAKLHGLNTDASFRFERGIDPNNTVNALKRAAVLIQEICGAKIESSIQDIYPEPIKDFLVELHYKNVDRILGQKLERNLIKKIIQNLDIKILHETKSTLRLNVPSYRVDVKREIDLIEEILRLYGFNRIHIPEQAKSSLIPSVQKSANKLENSIANLLSSKGYYEMLNNSLTNKENLITDGKEVGIQNPLSQELAILRQSLLFDGLKTISYNLNRKRKDLKLFEFGKTYFQEDLGSFKENFELGIWISGQRDIENWNRKSAEVSFFDLKEAVFALLNRLGFTNVKESQNEKSNFYDSSISISRGKTELAQLGLINQYILSRYDVSQKVYYARVNWSNCISAINRNEIKFKAVSKYPVVRRDLALLLDEGTSFIKIKELAFDAEKRLLKAVSLFDVYEGKNLKEDKKSYGVSFTFQDNEKTLTDQHIDKIMDRLIQKLKQEFNAELR